MRKTSLSFLLMVALGLLLTPYDSLAETVAERFEQQMKKFAESCAKKKPRPGDITCDRLKLKPADPLATEEGRFAHSIKVPNPVPADSGYKSGMTSQEYFELLCKTEAGEFIFKTVENVEGLYLMRPRKKATDYELGHLYALEDPYGDIDFAASKPEDYFVQPPLGRYLYLESPNTSKSSARGVYLRYYRGDPKSSKKDFVFMKGNHSERVPYVVQSEEVSELKSRYGFSWRGLKRAHDRELGIVGGELIILDLQTNEALAVRRGYIRSGDARNNMSGVWWLGGHVCPKYGDNTVYMSEFISKVLKPTEGESHASK